MSCAAGPDVSESGLILALDGANYKSFKGSAATNILVGISPNQADQNSALYKVVNGNETVYIPSIGYVNSKYVDFYNDYNGGSGACCPNLFSYGTGLAVSASTTYTYSIIYKTTTGYSHPNYMYRYEYNGSGGYVTESGIHNTSNRTSLGNDWWFAWGQFTTQATTAILNAFMFHYEYATQNRIYVYKAALYSGSHIIPYQYMLDSGQTRGTTVATGGGWADMSGNGNNGELANGVRESSDNLGALVFSGTNDYVNSNLTLGTDATIEFVAKANWNQNNSGQPIPISINGDNYSSGPQPFFYNNRINWNTGDSGSNPFSNSYIPDTNWHIFCISNNFSSGIATLHIDGVLIGTATALNMTTTGSNKLWIGRWHDGGYLVNMNLSSVKIYNRALTASEIQQNFNATRSRFGI